MSNFRGELEKILTRGDECEDPLEQCHWKEDTVDQIMELRKKKEQELREKIEGMREKQLDEETKQDWLMNGYDSARELGQMEGKEQALDDVLEVIK